MSSFLVLSGGLSPERDVSLRSGRRVAEALRLVVNAEVLEADVDAGLIQSLLNLQPDCGSVLRFRATPPPPPSVHLCPALGK